MNISQIKALTFDVFGTAVDWRGSIITEGGRLDQTRGIRVDWAKFADAWRAGYGPYMNRVRCGELPWTNIDALHRMILDTLMVDFGVTGLSETDTDHLNRVWHRLQPWPDAVAGLERLRQKYITATLSNGNMALLVNMARYAGLRWDCILSAELVKHYKPDPEVYQIAAALLGLQTDQVMMVAAHKGDLKAAQAVGMKTAFVTRPLEFGPQGHVDLTPEPWMDIFAVDFNDLATRLGV